MDSVKYFYTVNQSSTRIPPNHMFNFIILKYWYDMPEHVIILLEYGIKKVYSNIVLILIYILTKKN